ncbi:MAG: FadR family transcriptional regulator [Deltaproteobacteria bacterium]|nr:FadR family transcriptional regulator [Deltaproteobacteria bacterium]
MTRRRTEASGEGREGLLDRKADVVARALMGRIVSGRYPVGSVLPREEDLVLEHAASRGVVREAIKLLEVHRLVRPVRRRGTEVLDPMRSLSPEVVRAMLAPHGGSVDRTMLAGLLEVRALLDVEISALAATRRTDDDLRALDAILRESAPLLGDPEAYVLVAGRMGRTLARAAKNRLFEMLSAWNEIVARDLEPLFAATRPAPAPHHQALVLLVELVRRKDAAGVRELVSAFHAWASPRLLQAADLSRSGDTFPTFTAAEPATKRASNPRVRPSTTKRASTKDPRKKRASASPKKPSKKPSKNA